MKKAFAETERHRLPSFDCPNPDCRAKHIAFATSREQQYVLYRHREKPIISIYDLRHYTGIAT